MRRASTGLILEALHAGITPARPPTIVASSDREKQELRRQDRNDRHSDVVVLDCRRSSGTSASCSKCAPPPPLATVAPPMRPRMPA